MYSNCFDMYRYCKVVWKNSRKIWQLTYSILPLETWNIQVVVLRVQLGYSSWEYTFCVAVSTVAAYNGPRWSFYVCRLLCEDSWWKCGYGDVWGTELYYCTSTHGLRTYGEFSRIGFYFFLIANLQQSNMFMFHMLAVKCQIGSIYVFLYRALLQWDKEVTLSVYAKKSYHGIFFRYHVCYWGTVKIVKPLRR